MTADLMDARRIATIRRLYFGSDSEEYHAALDRIAEIEKTSRRPSPEEVGRIYISGAMTGHPDFNRPAFYNAEAALYLQGYRNVANPARIEGDDAKPWDWWMRHALEMLLTCQTIVMLPGWVDSRGAMLEHHIARKLDMRVYEWIGGELESNDLPF